MNLYSKISKILERYKYTLKRIWEELRYALKQRFENGWRMFKFGWIHPYAFDKVDTFDDYVILELKDFVENGNIELIDWHHKDYNEDGSICEHSKIRMQVHKDMMKIYKYFHKGGFEKDEKLLEDKMKKTTWYNQDFDEWFEPIENSNYFRHIPSPKTKENSDYTRTRKRIEKKRKDYANRIWEIRDFLWT